MKIGFVLPNLNGGGAEKAIMNIGLGLEARGHEVHLFLLGEKFDYQSRLTTHLVMPKAARKSYLGKRRTAQALKKLHQKLSSDTQFDFIVSSLPYADEVVSLANIPNVWYRIANTLSEQVGLVRSRKTLKAKLLLRRYRALYENKNLIAISNGVKEDMVGRLGICLNSVVMIHNSFAFEHIREAGEQPRSFTEPYIIHVGRFSRQKRHDLLFEAFAGMPLHHKLVLLTHKTDALLQMIDDYGIAERVYLAGFQQNPYPWIKGADLLVLCSDYEGLGNVLVESLILGTKVVATDCRSGPREIIGDLAEDCLVPTGDAVALQQAISRSLRRQFRLPSGFAERFSQEHTLDLYEACGEYECNEPSCD